MTSRMYRGLRGVSNGRCFQRASLRATRTIAPFCCGLDGRTLRVLRRGRCMLNWPKTVRSGGSWLAVRPRRPKFRRRVAFERWHPWKRTSIVFPKADPLRPLFLADRPGGGKPDWTYNMLLKHGVRSCLEYAKSFDLAPMPFRTRNLPHTSSSLTLAATAMRRFGSARMKCAPSSSAFRGRSRAVNALTADHFAIGSCIARGFGEPARSPSSSNKCSKAISAFPLRMQLRHSRLSSPPLPQRFAADAVLNFNSVPQMLTCPPSDRQWRERASQQYPAAT